MNFLKKIGLILLVIAALGGCRSTSEKIVIIATNDIHAQISHFPRLAAFIEQKRSEGEVIVVDAGDRFSGNPYVDNAAQRGKPVIELMNKVGYEVACLGNHDFDYGQGVLKDRAQEARFPVICGNLVSEGSELGQLPSHYIMEKGGLKFGFFSLIQTGRNHLPATNPANLEKISFRYYKDLVPEYKQLEKKCDVLIGLTHLGFANDSLLALVMPEVDVIVGGHSHTVIREPKTVNGVLITQAGSNLNYVGVTTLQFKNKKLIDKSYHLVSLRDFGATNKEVKLMVEEINDRPEFKEVLGSAVEEFKNKEEVASLVTDAMCEIAGTDFAFYNKGGVRLHTIPEGGITREMIYKLEPFSNYIVTHEWPLESMQEFILKDFNRLKEPEKRYINYYISDGKYEIIRDKEGNGIEVKFYDKSGELLKGNKKKYKIAFSNYVASSNELVRGGERTDIYIADAIVDFLQKEQKVIPHLQRAFIQ